MYLLLNAIIGEQVFIFLTFYNYLMRKTLLTIVALLSGVMSSAQTPVADVLNVVYNDDGTVVDASAMNNPVFVMGSPDIKKSTQ